MTEPRSEELLTPNRAARLLSLSVCTVYRWLLAGRLRGLRLGQQGPGRKPRWRVRRADVEAMLHAQAPEESPASAAPSFVSRRQARVNHQAAVRRLRAAGFAI